MNNRGELGQDAMEYIQTVKELEANINLFKQLCKYEKK